MFETGIFLCFAVLIVRFHTLITKTSRNLDATHEFVKQAQKSKD